MVRFVSRSGVWRNSEDEILKGAVMKYGLQQWSTISSLLVRKSAKQCKARWYEWLDPSIRKGEWNRADEELLLKLAKAMPNRWRTIAPMLRRTPEQCIKQYEKLLDAAENAAEGESSGAPRPLPLSIDVAPENRPARPDAVDLEDEELEMIAEARARLANTKGKKEKRLMRERALEEAKRIAAIQKQRELRAAGIDVKKKKRKNGEIDYEKEIPFQHLAPQGLFSTAEEDARLAQPKAPFKAQSLDHLTKGGKKKEQIEKEEKAKKKQKVAPLSAEAQLEIEVSRLRQEDYEAQLKNRILPQLPKPQLSEEEIAALVGIKAAEAGKRSTFGMAEFSQTAGARPTLSKAEMRQMQKKFQELFKTLPDPQNEYSIQAPMDDEEEEENEPEAINYEVPLDAEDIEARAEAERKRHAKEIFSRQTLVRQRGLPTIKNFRPTASDQVKMLVQQEMAQLIKCDLREEIPPAVNLKGVQSEILKELNRIHSQSCSTMEEFYQLADSSIMTIEFQTSLNPLLNTIAPPYDENIQESLRIQLNSYQNWWKSEFPPLEKEFSHYSQKSLEMYQENISLYSQYDQLEYEYHQFTHSLSLQEEFGSLNRLIRIKGEVEKVAQREFSDQQKYYRLVEKRKDIQGKLAKEGIIVE